MLSRVILGDIGALSKALEYHRHIDMNCILAWLLIRYLGKDPSLPMGLFILYSTNLLPMLD